MVLTNFSRTYPDPVLHTTGCPANGCAPESTGTAEVRELLWVLWVEARLTLGEHKFQTQVLLGLSQ